MKLRFMLLLLLATHVAFSQNDHFKKGQTDMQLGVGFFSTLNNNIRVLGYDVSSSFKVPPLNLAADFGVSDAVSIGGTIAYAKSSLKYENVDAGSVSHLIVGVRGLYHFDLIPSVDTYGGVLLAYNAASTQPPSWYTDNDYETDNTKGVTYTFLVGGRYRFAKHAGIFLEVGYGVTAINLGLNFKF